MGGGHKHAGHKVLLLGLQADNAAAAALLAAVGVHRQTFDITLMGQRNHVFLFFDQILNIDIVRSRLNRGTSRVTELIADCADFLF